MCFVFSTFSLCFKGYFILGFFICQTLTDVIKFTVGRLRPNFIAVCMPQWDKLDCTNHAYIIQANCTGDEKIVRDARLSFPSSHASVSFYTMTFSVVRNFSL